MSIAVERGFEVRNGVIQTPGKFEGEPEYVLYFYDLMMMSGEDEVIHDEDGTPVSIFYLDAEDREKFKIGEDVHALALWTSEEGFVNMSEMTREEVEAFVATCEGGETECPSCGGTGGMGHCNRCNASGYVWVSN